MNNNIKLRPLKIGDMQGMQEWMMEEECRKWFQFPQEYALKEKSKKTTARV